jgi:hypothetical protein
MASDYPASVDAFPDPLVNSPLNSPSHAALHQDVNDAVEKIEVKLGVGVSPASGASDGQVLMADGSGGTEWASITADEIDSTGEPAQRVLASDGSGGAGWVSNETGLVLITTGTLSSTFTNIVGCFSSEFRNYRIILDQVSLDPSGLIYWQLLNGTTPNTANYRWSLLGQTGLGAAVNTATNVGQPAAFTGIENAVGVGNLVLCTATMDIMGAFIAQRTFAHTSSISFPSPNAFRYGLTMNNDSVSYDGIRFLTQTASTMAGNYAVYGYRN